MINGDYELIVPPKDYPGHLYRGKYALEHRVVWWENTGYLPGPNEDIHHINGQKRDNRFENLELVNHAEHARNHSTIGRTMIKLVCPNCDTILCCSVQKQFGSVTQPGQRNGLLIRKSWVRIPLDPPSWPSGEVGTQ